MRRKFDRRVTCAAAVAVIAVALALPSAASSAAPTATTGAATGITPSQATLHGTGDAGGRPASGYFEYASDADWGSGGYTHSTHESSFGFTFGPLPALIPPGGSSMSSITRDLAPATTYHYRFVVEQGACETPMEIGCPEPPLTAYGEDRTFRTTGAPSVETLSATGLGNRTATLNASVNPNGVDTTYRFEWGTSTEYGNSVPVPDATAGSGTTDDAVSETLSGLEPGTEYHFRVVAANDEGQTTGQDATFTTASVPIAITGQADAVTATGARLNGTANAQNGTGTKYAFEYCEEADFDAGTGSCTAILSTEATELGWADAGDHPVSQSLPEGTLAPTTTYRFRLVVSRGTASVAGSFAQFTTPSAELPLGPPIVLTGDATSVEAKTATVSGLVNPNGLPTRYWFEYGTSPTDFSRLSPADGEEVGSDFETHPVSRTLSGLKAKTTYYFRLVGVNEAGQGIGQAGTFTTASSGKGKKGGPGG